MANFLKYLPFEEEWEGIDYENVPGDSGGCTKFGLTVDDIIKYYGKGDCLDVKNLNSVNAPLIIRKLYWDFFKADLISNQSIAEIIVDGGLNQGDSKIAKLVQQILHVSVDGVFGNHTIGAINMCNQENLFNTIKLVRKTIYDNIIKSNPGYRKFYAGWMNRLNDLKFSL